MKNWLKNGLFGIVFGGGAMATSFCLLTEMSSVGLWLILGFGEAILIGAVLIAIRLKAKMVRSLVFWLTLIISDPLTAGAIVYYPDEFRLYLCVAWGLMVIVLIGYSLKTKRTGLQKAT